MSEPTDFDFEFDFERSQSERGDADAAREKDSPPDNGEAAGADDPVGFDFGEPEAEDASNGAPSEGVLEERPRRGARGLAGPESLGERPRRNGPRRGAKDGKRSRTGGNGRRSGERSIAGITMPKLGRKNAGGRRSGNGGSRLEAPPAEPDGPDAPDAPDAPPTPDVPGEPEAPAARGTVTPFEAPDARKTVARQHDLREPGTGESTAAEPPEEKGPESLDAYLERTERSRIKMPDLSGVGERIKSLRLPDRLPDLGSLGRGNGEGPPRGRIKLPGRPGGPGGKRKKGQIKIWRLVIILCGLGLLAMVSTVFGMMMAVAGDLPNLENRTEYNASENSVVYDFKGKKLGTLAPNNRRILVESDDIAQSMKQAAVAIEDQRFYEHRGVDFQGIGRAVVADLMPGGSTQGASTITQQFVKNALEAQGSRTVFQKLRESALAYHLERQWDKDKILTQYLNSIYFGEGAYGIEAAARTYFGASHPDCGQDGQPKCASLLQPEESAMLAGIISAPSAFSPRGNPNDALERRNLVLSKMEDQGYLTASEYEESSSTVLPSVGLIKPPEEDSVSPYFTSWLRQVLVDRYGAGRAFGGGLRVRTTLDLDLQESVESAVYNTLSGILPTGAAVVIDNKTGGIRALVGGNNFEEEPFNLATQGHRQPGSSFKPFTLITALENGHSPGETYTSAQNTYTVPNSGGKEKFELHNYDDIYYGALDVATGTIKSDNNVYMQLGYNIVDKPEWSWTRNAQESFNRIEATANEMGIATDITGNLRANPAMVLGGLIQGVTPLEMTHAFNTIANDGERVSGSGASYKGGPVAVLEVLDKDGNTVDENHTKKNRAISEDTAATARSILGGVIGSGGTGRRANTGVDGEWGKTGTTDDNGDAWFCGGTPEITACVWVGHPQTNTPMETEFAGEPVDGGTFPALIWAQIINAYQNVQAAREAGVDDVGAVGGYGGGSSGGGSTGGGGGEGGDGGDGGGGAGNAAPAPAPSGGGGAGVGSGL